jgi:hypothetical protein
MFTALALSAQTSVAQQSAEEIMRANSSDEEGPDSIRSQENQLLDDGGTWIGLTVSSALATGSSGWVYMAVVQNFTDQRACIRVKRNDLSGTHVSLDRTDGNYIVEPHDSFAFLVASAEQPTSISHKILSWAPDAGAPDGRKCSSTEPAEMQDWLAGPVE